jgi:hypothetical protein
MSMLFLWMAHDEEVEDLGDLESTLPPASGAVGDSFSNAMN